MNVRNWCQGLALMLYAALAGCGGGSSGGPAGAAGGNGPDPNAIEGSGRKRYTSIGAIDAIDSAGKVTVNGVTLSLSGAAVDIDGRSVAAAELRVGHVVTVQGDLDADSKPATIATTSADLVVAGRIQALDVAHNRVTILGQPVEIDAQTNIADVQPDAPLGGLAVDDDVEVSGFTDSNGVIFARSIEPRRSATPLIVSGTVAGLDTANHRMTIGGQPVEYADATLTGFGSVPLDGATVQVNGDLVASGGALHATEIVYVDRRVPGQVGDVVLLEGWVTRFASTSDFDVDGHAVTTTADTVTNGSWGDKLSIVRLDAFILLQGKLVAGGVIEATEITITNLITMNARIASVDATRIVAIGRVFYGYEKCAFENSVIAVDDVPTDWHALQVGDRVTLHELIDPQSVRPAPPGGWTRPTRAPVCKIVTVTHNLRGPVDSVDAASASLIVMGQKVWLGPDTTVLGARGPDRRAALATLQAGDEVQVSGLLSAEGEIAGTAITMAPAGRDYRIINLARNVDASLKQMQVGTLTVDYAAAQLVGFTGAAPSAGDRVVVIADAPPVGGLLRATAVRNGAAPLRGEMQNLVFLDGLVTRFVSPTDYDVDGRPAVPLPVTPEPSEYFDRVGCDPGLMHVNLPMALFAVRMENGELAQFHTVCPPARWRQPQFAGLPSGFDAEQPADASIAGPVTGVDVTRRELTVGGLTVHLGRATLLTRALWPVNEPDQANSVPLTLGDIVVGDHVQFSAHAYGAAEALSNDVVVDNRVATSPDTVMSGTVAATARPDFSLGALTVHTDAQTAFSHAESDDIDCTVIADAADVFWTRIDDVIASGTDAGVRVTTTWTGSQWVATRVEHGNCDGWYSAY